MKPKSQLQAEALERQEDRENRTPQEQLAVLDNRRGNSTRERESLLRQIDDPATESHNKKKRQRGDK